MASFINLSLTTPEINLASTLSIYIYIYILSNFLLNAFNYILINNKHYKINFKVDPCFKAVLNIIFYYSSNIGNPIFCQKNSEMGPHGCEKGACLTSK